MDNQGEQKPHIPDFMKKYHDALDYDGQHEIERAAQHYETERQHFMNNEFVAKSNFQADYNRATGQNKKIYIKEALRPLQEKHEQLARTKAMQFGYVEKAEEAQQEEPGLSRKEQFKKQAAELRTRQGQQAYQAKTKRDDQKPVEQPSDHQVIKDQPEQQGEAEKPQSAKDTFLANAAAIRERQQQNPQRPR